ncbi:MAG TPA: hypothetical protein VK928_01120 [Longimicrobiales bacterium]|nr:hypothetical protein [Longimicrobiales bacterium]
MAKQIDRGPAGDEDPQKVSEGLGGLTGAAAGAGLGAILGPVGMVVGGIAGAVGGWWAGHGVAQAAGDFDDETDGHYRRLHEEQHGTTDDFDDARYYYRLGSLARRNPDYEGRPFTEVEPDLRRGWQDQQGRGWEDVRSFVHRGYEHPPR